MSNLPADRPRVICLCGSLRFSADIAAERSRLTRELAIVLGPEATEEAARDPELVRALGDLHLRRIDLADEVRVVNPGGYLGESTRREIAYAIAAGKSITYVEEPAT